MTTQPAVPLTRRERQRQATHDEIIDVARRLLKRGDQSLSIRGVASEMGMTPPALYRYVDGYDDLLVLVARSIFGDVVAQLAEASDRYPDENPAAQLVAAAIGFRRWALAHPDEFGLIFANRAVNKGEPNSAQETGADQFAAFFGDIYERLWDATHFDVPAESDLPEGLPDALRGLAEAGQVPCTFPGRPISLMWVLMRAWSRLYGMVTLEVFGHVHPDLIENAVLFRSMMQDNGRDLGLGQPSDAPELWQIIDAELRRE